MALVTRPRIDPAGGPEPGSHNFFRGGPLEIYDVETRNAIAAVPELINTELATEVWEAGLAATSQGRPVWVHGDVAAGTCWSRMAGLRR
jgi:aminoglycoside phosphotransferase (APT) family kinase protein